jgi:hypothetical protein
MEENFYKENLKDLTSQDIKKIISGTCNTRGEHILITEKDILEFKGIEGVKKMKEELRRLRIDLDFGKVDPLGWYPRGIMIILFWICRDVLGYNNDDFFKAGERALRFSFMVKFFLNYFVSREKAFKNISKYWAKNFSCGRLEPVEFHDSHKEGHYFIIRLHDFQDIPVSCWFFKGYFLQVSKLLGGENVKIEETKCVFSGDAFHEFLVKWE